MLSCDRCPCGSLIQHTHEKLPVKTPGHLQGSSVINFCFRSDLTVVGVLSVFWGAVIWFCLSVTWCRVRSGRSRGERRREAVVDGASYKAVGSALLVAEMSVGFLQFAAHFPAIGTDVLTRVAELLRVGLLYCQISDLYYKQPFFA